MGDSALDGDGRFGLVRGKGRWDLAGGDRFEGGLVAVTSLVSTGRSFKVVDCMHVDVAFRPSGDWGFSFIGDRWEVVFGEVDFGRDTVRVPSAGGFGSSVALVTD